MASAALAQLLTCCKALTAVASSRSVSCWARVIAAVASGVQAGCWSVEGVIRCSISLSNKHLSPLHYCHNYSYITCKPKSENQPPFPCRSLCCYAVKRGINPKEDHKREHEGGGGRFEDAFHSIQFPHFEFGKAERRTANARRSASVPPASVRGTPASLLLLLLPPRFSMRVCRRVVAVPSASPRRRLHLTLSLCSPTLLPETRSGGHVARFVLRWPRLPAGPIRHRRCLVRTGGTRPLPLRGQLLPIQCSRGPAAARHPTAAGRQRRANRCSDVG